MATYYRWQKNTISTTDSVQTITTTGTISSNFRYCTTYNIHINPDTLMYNIDDYESHAASSSPDSYGTGTIIFANQNMITSYYKVTSGNARVYLTDSGGSSRTVLSVHYGGQIGTAEQHFNPRLTAGTSQGNVYSTNISEYPSNGKYENYWYNNRTTVVSPTTASNLTYPENFYIIEGATINPKLQWTGAQSNTPYPVTQYEVSYAINNTDSWQVAGTTGVLTYEFSSIPEEATSIAFRVRAKDSNNQYGDYVTGTYSTISRESPITVVTKNIEMNYFNGTDYEILYPVVGSEVYNNVKSGNYIGSGQYGQSNPSSLEFEFTPKMVMIAKTSGVYDTYLLKGKTVSYVQSSTGVSEITVEWTGNKVSWYSAESAGIQLNESGTLYYYVVFG